LGRAPHGNACGHQMISYPSSKRAFGTDHCKVDTMVSCDLDHTLPVERVDSF
jgi:hypothetical protein